MVTALLFTEGDWRHKVYKEEITLPVASLIALLVTIYTIFVTKIKIHSTNFFYFLNFHREWSVHHLPWLLMIPLLTSQFRHPWHLADRLFFHSKSNIYSWLNKGHHFRISSLLLPLFIVFFHVFIACLALIEHGFNIIVTNLLFIRNTSFLLQNEHQNQQ